MALCNLCRVDVGCSCNLSADSLCVNCQPKQYIKKNTTIVNNNNGGNNVKYPKKRKLGYQ